MANSTGRKIKNYVLNSLKLVFAFSIIVWLVTSRYPFLTDKISEATEYYSFVDMYGYRAASWLKNVYPYKSTIVVTEKPGIFFGLISNKNAVMETNPLVERAALAETVLNLAYEMENSVQLLT